MRLALVVSEMGVGGAERVVVELARSCRERGDFVAVLADPGRLDGELEKLGVLRAPLAHGRTPRALGRAARSGIGLVRDFRPDILHAHNVRVTALARIAAQLGQPRGRPPVVATYHGVPPDEARAAARVLRLADTVVCVSAGLQEELTAHGVPARALRVIPNGVAAPAALDPATAAQLDRQLDLGPGPVIAAVGRLAPQKAHDRFLRAAATVHRAHPDARFLIVGDGALRSELEAQADRLGIACAIRFTGVRDDAPELISRSDMLVFSSIWEGLSIAALEAMAAGVPVISTDVAGTAELLATGAGVVVDHDDDALAEAIGGMIASPERRAAMGAEGRSLHFRRFSSVKMAERYADTYNDLIERHSGARSPVRA